MSSDTDGSASEPKPEPDSSSETERGQEGWLDRLKAAVGIRPAASARKELAEALATEAADAGFSSEERAMLANILSLRDVRVDDVMVPRRDILGIDADVTLGELLDAFERSGHSRMPVYRETLDDPIGFVHIKDLVVYLVSAARVVPADGATGAPSPGNLDLRHIDLSRKLSASNLVRDVLFVPPSMPVTTLLASMQAAHMQLALVIDEYGGTDGLVSLEDVVEMVVGDIEDEHDEESAMIVPEGDGTFLADARADLDEVAAAIGGDFARGEEGEEADTVGGLVVGVLGRVPVRGERIKVPGDFEIEVLEADPRRLKRLRIYRSAPGSSGTAGRQPDPAKDEPPATGA